MTKPILTQFSLFVKTLGKFLRKYVVSLLLFVLFFGIGFCLGAKIFSRPAITVSGNMVDLNTLMTETNKIKEQNMASVGGLNPFDTSTTTLGVSYYVASSRGKNYYPNTCKAASSLSSANLIKFNTEEEAKSAGYTKSSQCK